MSTNCISIHCTQQSASGCALQHLQIHPCPIPLRLLALGNAPKQLMALLSSGTKPGPASVCRSRAGLELQTGRHTCWQPYTPSQAALQQLAWQAQPRQLTQLSSLQEALLGSHLDMTCALLCAGPVYPGELHPHGLVPCCLPPC